MLALLLVSPASQAGKNPWPTSLAESSFPPSPRMEGASAALEPSDLPPDFKPAPAFLKRTILNGMAALAPELARERISWQEEDVSIFVDVTNAELVMGLTSRLLDQSSVRNFDAGLRRQDARELFAEGLKQSLKFLGPVRVTEVEEIPSLQGIGELARGATLKADFEKLPLSLYGEAIAFRRGSVGALVLAGTLNSTLKGVGVRELAGKLDRRLLRQIQY